MDTGSSSKNTRRTIDITNLAQHLGSDVYAALPGLHAFTGCDFTAAFMREGKSRPYDIMVSDASFLTAFSSLGKSTKCSDVEAARFHLFCQLYAPPDCTQPMERLKTSDPCCLPPCNATLLQKISRTNYVALLWKNVKTRTLTDLNQ